jgi:hypothetical protein
MSKRKIYTDGWHYNVAGSSLSVYVENGYFIRGTAGTGFDYRTVYPYRYSSKLGCWNNRSGCVKAFYSTVWKYRWT